MAKKNERWEIIKPLQARGDDQKIGDLLAQVTNARVQEFIADVNTGAYPQPQHNVPMQDVEFEAFKTGLGL